ncbi:DUF1002 domain-containing protein [Terrisporobacter mayombei]|uniref:DUF1002 domain-containing protein n=1 Tax=Terrisporobacter mayombei TaxID=1541 RepID=A0ABY9PXM7_9FIRM|nr:DUF1002 domain-containing protein [Terrisporobacter mayombei]MCC3867852.1 DUF1002 domain-containing protein [Terrisporobacter mayombei]WMT79984.1 hypothetical protein TEMA_02570 [Terrisporobacter mayombei]
MKFKKKVSSLLVAMTIIASSIVPSFADGTRVVTIGVNNTAEQRQKIFSYFGVKENEVQVLEVNNKEEREYLGGVATEAQLGTKTYSCSYVEPTNSGGINVKTANITWVTSSMVASTLSTAGMTNANAVIAAVFPVSGTGALTGVMKAFEDASGKKLDEDKKELASEELITTGDLGDKIGQDEATGVVNDIKTEVIKNGTSDVTQIADIINNVTNNYNVTLTDAQIKQITDLMEKIAAQKYDYNSMKQTLNNVSDVVQDNLKEAGKEVGNSGIMDSVGGLFSSIGDWFSNLFGGSKDLGILGETKDDMLGSNAVINATDKAAEKLPSSEEVDGFFQKIINWFTGLFNNDSDKNNNSDNVSNNANSEKSKEENTQTPSKEEPTNNNVENNADSTDNKQDSQSTDNTQNSNKNTNDNSLNVQTENEEHFDSQNTNQ